MAIEIKPTASWMTQSGSYSEVVITSRVRLARNIRGEAFPHKLEEKDLRRIREKVFEACHGRSEFAGFRLSCVEELTQLERQGLLERYLTSKEHIQNPEGRGLIFETSGSVSVLVNEEDHLRVQALTRGLELRRVYEVANHLDDCLDEALGFAFSPRLGYLTACPTNVGTGLRASVMLHLPAMTLLGQIKQAVRAAQKVNLAVRGVYGEGSDAEGCLYQVSNQVTLGQSEEELLSEVEKIAQELVGHELAARRDLLRLQRWRVEDHVWRAYGILSTARSISASEATNHLSALRLGVDLGIFTGISDRRLMELLVWIRPACLQLLYGRELDTRDRDQLRATLLRNAVSAVKEATTA